MTAPRATLADGRLVIRADAWSLVEVRADRPQLRFSGADGTPLADVLPMACADTLEGPDEWLAVGEPVLAPDAATVRWPVTSARWASAALVLRATGDALAFRLELAGRGRLTDVRLLGGRGSGWPAIGTGRLWSGRRFARLVPGGPDDPAVIHGDAGRAAATGVVGGAQPGRGRWFFTPGPLAFAGSADGSPPWLGLGISVGSVDEASFTQLVWEADDNGFDLRLDYEGHTLVDGEWASPWAVLSPGHADPYASLAAAGRPGGGAAGAGPAAGPSAAGAVRPVPRWWLEPMFCGWGAQVAEAVDTGVPGPSLATQDRYDAWLARLEAHGVVPGTIVIDDKWQRTYGRNEPDESRWPDLAGWIAARQARGQRVLLWWKAWDAEGLPGAWTIRDPRGRRIAADPTHPEYASALGADIRHLLATRAAGGLGADGLKIDFTAASPSGAHLRTHEDGPWGIALLHRLLSIVSTAARAARPDALLVTHTPNALFADVTSMIRLNDALRLDDPVPLVPVVDQLRHRAAIVRAELPGVPVDTDDWAMPSLEEWRRWQEVKPGIGVPALYHVDGLGTADEHLGADDLELVAGAWAAYRDRLGVYDRADVPPRADPRVTATETP
ncbi:MAG TPA: hypothetical protein VFY23_05965 [Candidatus Limnocylindrales bacterium]|nr:hypothetical protein [Candidatus Limnocylindrales bacterium]